MLSVRIFMHKSAMQRQARTKKRDREQKKNAAEQRKTEYE